MSAWGYTNGLLPALSHAQSEVALSDLTYDVDGQLTMIADINDPMKYRLISYDPPHPPVQS